MAHAILLISCPDQKGITAAVADFVYQYNGNIVHADQHIDDQSNTFFMRIEWSVEGFHLSKEQTLERFLCVAQRFQMSWRIFFDDMKPRMAVFVSAKLHCLHDLLWKHRSGYLRCEIPLIISNHAVGKETAEEFGIDFMHVPVTPDIKTGQETAMMDLLRRHQIDLIVLARYHQIFTAHFVEQFQNQMINIHHSFLPSFPGSQPYAQAYRRGVKIIGATSHYVTTELDQGPIIEQDTVRVSHRDTLDDLIRKGEDLEKIVLSRAVRWELEHKILSYGNKTVVFD